MNTMELVRFVERAQSRPLHRSSAPLFYTELAGPARRAILRGRQRLVSEQRADGSWVGTQKGDASLPSQLIFVLTLLGQDPATVQQASNAILRTQLASGGWLLITYRGPGGATLELREGTDCQSPDDCVPDGPDAGASPFGDRDGVLVVGADGRYAVVADRGAPISWVAIGSDMDVADLQEYAAALTRVD